MRSGILTILFMIIVGVIIANALVNWRGVVAIFNAFTTWWRASVNGLLSRPT